MLSRMDQHMVEKAKRLWYEKFPRWAQVIDLHYSGMTPSQIDDKLMLKKGCSRRCMIRYWRFMDQLEKDGVITFAKPRSDRKNGKSGGPVQDMQALAEADRP